MKNNYKIVHREELVGWFYVEADSEEEALEEYQNLVNNGEIDFGDMEMVDSSDTVELVNDNNKVKQLWEEFGDVPMNPDTECIEEPWMDFPAGTFREDIWHWFEEKFNVSVYDLMYR